MSIFERSDSTGSETDQYGMFQDVDGVILVSNEYSTHGNNVSDKFKQALERIGKPFLEVITDKDPTETDRRIIEAHEAMQAKELGRVAILLATGDGELGKNAETFRRHGEFICSLGAGGAGNHYRSLISFFHRLPKQLFKHGFVVDGPTIKAELSTDDEKEGKEIIEAVTTFSGGFTADIAQLENSEKRRSNKLRKYFPTITAIPGAVKAIKESEPFTIIVDEREVALRALMFVRSLPVCQGR